MTTFQKLTECQARELLLRTHLDSLIDWASRTTVSGCTPIEILWATAALKTPYDDTALKAALSAERERCVVACGKVFVETGDVYAAEACAIAILALGDE
jgi:hypothetical protein